MMSCVIHRRLKSKMIKIGLISIWLGIVLMIASCASKAIPSGSKTGNYNDYNEDLGEVRPVYTPTSTTVAVKVSVPTSGNVHKTPAQSSAVETQHVNQQLDEIMDSMTLRNRSVRYASGFRIQIYSGNERQQADAAKLLVYQNFPELNTYLSYKQPTYRLKVGDFMRRVDAERYFSQLKQLFSTAVLQADKIDIRRSLTVN